jgi:gamma-glutamyltranspeptidase/glutathione hydrolase
VLVCLGASQRTQAASGVRGMVASEHALASAAGVEILQRGGNAVDAAAATALAVGVTNPTSCGIGGGGFMLIHLREGGVSVALDYRERAPAAARRDMFVRDGQVVPELSRFDGLAVAVPGEIAGLVHAVERHGRLPFAIVMEPALRLARDGFPIGDHLAEQIARHRDAIASRSNLSQVLLREPGGAPLGRGEILRRPALAKALESISLEGAEAFYRGWIARDVVAAVREAGGVLAAEDLVRYRVIERAPLRGRYRGLDLLTMPPPSSGGGVLTQILNVIARDEVATLGHNLPTTLHLLAEAMKHAFADRAEAYGDPDFVEVPILRLLSSEYANSLRARISARTTFGREFYGQHAPLVDRGGTSHLSVVDADGNAVACTTSINTSFGSMVLAPASGVLLNNTMDDFSAHPGVANVYGLIGSEANAVAPDKRPLSSMTPAILLDRGRARFVAGGSGGPVIITATLQTLLNVVDFGMNVEAAVAAPRVHHQWLPEVLLVEPGIDRDARAALQRRGHQLHEVPELAAVQAIVSLPQGGYEGAADPRKGGEAMGW